MQVRHCDVVAMIWLIGGDRAGASSATEEPQKAHIHNLMPQCPCGISANTQPILKRACTPPQKGASKKSAVKLVVQVAECVFT